MKKFMKVCAIAALIFLALGAALAAVAGTVRGREAITRVVEKVTGGRVILNLDGFVNWGIRMSDSLPELDYDIDEAASFDSRYDILTGNVQRFRLGEEVEVLKIEAGGCRFQTKSSGDASFYVETSGSGKFQAYLENGILQIRETPTSRRWNSWDEWEKCVVILYVPEGYHYGEVDISLGAGELEINGLDGDKVSLEVGAGRIAADGLKAGTLELKAGMGQIELRNVDVRELEAEIGMGELSLQGNIEESADASCAMGNVDMRLTGSQEDFNYRISGAMGNIDLGSESYSGLGMSKTVDNGAAKNMELECEAGNITITFTE